ncbi:MAG: putative YigZ family protein [Candidatus Marivariicella framensis]|jgi:uncharacterized YigZ family protein|tara:strand:+ start:480 stop:1073 length:594 start_codon:yes stop_codon:yes gene_type:complete
MKKTYRTININSESLFKEKQSKFFGFAFPVSEIQAIKKHIDKLKKIHHTARHFCYAYQIGITKTIYRLNDDGEPRNTAGLPIYGQIQSFDLTNILIVVVRYFGGTKLGVGGLVSAYKECAKLTIVANKIITKEIIIPIKIKFEYPLMNSVMRIIKEYHLEIENQEMHTSCIFEILTTKKNNVTVSNQFKQNPGIEIL